MRDFKIYLIIASVLLIVYLSIELNRPAPVIWTPTYAREDKIPFGTYILYNRLNDIFPGSAIRTFREPVYNVIRDHDIHDATYIIIAGRVDLDIYDVGKLMSFLRKGNDVFISAQWLGDSLTSKLKLETSVTYSGGDSTLDRIHFLNKQLDPKKKYILPKEEQYDSYFSMIDTAHAVSLAQNDSSNTTLVKYSIGKGHLYLDTHPRMFTNYNLVNPDGPEYVARVLSYLKVSKTIIWDEYYNKGREGEESVMRVFFNNKALKWAYLIAIISFAVFILYEMKRRQRIIPIVEPLKNSSLDFVNVVGQVYYEQHNNLNIAQKKITYFLEYLRSKYYLKTNPLDQEFIERLTLKTGVERSQAEEIVNHINYLNNQDRVSDRDLILLNQLIQQFYIKSR